MVAMIANRFQLDRSRGKTISMLNLYAIELHGSKRVDIQSFVNRVRHVGNNVNNADIKDKQIMFEWLFEKFKSCHAIEHDIRKIRKSRDGSKKRTWKFLWRSIIEYLDFFHEDSNYISMKAHIAGAKVPGTPAAPRTSACVIFALGPAR